MRRITATVISMAAVAVMSLAAAPAYAGSPWWHLASGSRPAYLKPGQARSEVQELLTTPADFGSFTDQTNFVLEFKREGNHVSLEEFATEPVAKEFGVTLLSAANIQSALEEKLYGAGNVTVKEEAMAADGKPLENGEKRYVIANVAGTANQAVTPLESRPEIGTVETKIATSGRPDGEIYVTAANLGDQPLSGARSPVILSDALPHGLRAVAIEASKPGERGSFKARLPLSCDLQTVSCTLGAAQAPFEALAPFDRLEMRVAVDVEPGAAGETEVKIEGGQGYVCDAVAPGTGGYRDSGCMDEAPGTSFERVSTVVPQPVSLRRAINVNAAATPFGVEDYSLENEEEGGAAATQAGAHPFQQTTTIALNQTADASPPGSGAGVPSGLNPAAQPKDLHFRWPAGLIGNPAPIPRCPDVEFFQSTEGGGATACPPDTAVGVATVDVDEPGNVGVVEITVPLFNLVPRVGEPARFGFNVTEGNSPVTIDTSVRTGGDYGVTVQANNLTQTVGFLSSEVTVWGVPGDARHDRQRGSACLLEGEGFIGEQLAPCAAAESRNPPPFLSLPTACRGPLHSTVDGDTWVNAGTFSELAEDEMPALDGCNRLPFSPSIKVTPDGTAASTPTGLTVDVHVPQEESLNAAGLAISDPRDITVALPEGVAVNPAGGDGLQACSETLAGFTGFGEFTPPSRTATFTETLPNQLQPGLNFCPDGSKIATVKIKTPILPNPIEGAVYLATQNQNPFGSLIALYVVAEDPVSGVLIKLVGETHLTATGQIVTTFHDSPQAPFEDAEFHFFGGERAPLTTPARCGAYTTTATLTPWSGNPPSTVSSTFNVTTGPNGSPCPGASLPFSPTLTGGTTNIDAGAFSPLTTTIGRDDGQQNLHSVVLHMPGGLEGLLAGVKLCAEAQANDGTCGPESQIGETTVSAGVGGDPVTVKGGKVYITEKYAGAPFGLSIVNPVKAGPFDLEHDTSNPAQQPACDCVVVRAKIDVDPRTAQLTITTDTEGAHAIPSVIDGIPVQIKKVNVTVNREHFTFNPTNCAPMNIAGTLTGYEGAASPLTVPFQATNCALLKYGPKLTVTTKGKASKLNGQSLLFKLSYPKNAMGSQAWFNEAKFDIPKQLPARLTTIQQACLADTFEHNRSACPAHSIVGHAIVRTPVLPVPLEGPVYFVSYGGAAFPDAVLVLKGYGITIELHGNTFIDSKTGVTSATFRNTPDVPFETLEVTLPTGPFSEFGTNLPHSSYNFCGRKLTMPTLFKASNGLEIHQNTAVAVTGCAKAKKTRAQQLAAALGICHKKHPKAKRAGCETQARRRYGHVKKNKK